MELNVVDRTLATMIANWPDSYRNRLSALRKVFVEGTEWNADGTIWNTALDGPSNKIADNVDEAVAESMGFYEGLPDTPENRARRQREEATTRLRVLHRNATVQFIRDNAELLAVASCRFEYVPRFPMSALNDIPLDRLTPEWKAALVEFCKAILEFTNKDLARCEEKHGPSADYAPRLAEAYATAREALARINPEFADRARREEIERLRSEAAKLGFKLAPLND